VRPKVRRVISLPEFFCNGLTFHVFDGCLDSIGVRMPPNS
jgi:hypothetical protein